MTTEIPEAFRCLLEHPFTLPNFDYDGKRLSKQLHFLLGHLKYCAVVTEFVLKCSMQLQIIVTFPNIPCSLHHYPRLQSMLSMNNEL